MRYKNVPADRDYELNYGGCVYSAMQDGERIPVILHGDENQLVARGGVYGEPVDINTVEIKWPSLGMRNSTQSKSAVFCSKRACKQYRRGPKTSNLDVVSVTDRGVRKVRSQCALEFGGVELYDPTFPTKGLARRMFKRGWVSVALSPDVALTVGGKVFFKCWHVGDLKDGVMSWRGNATPHVKRTCIKVLSILE